MTTRKGSIRAALLTLVILIAGILLFFEHTRSSSVESGELLDAPAEYSPNVRVIAEHPPIELIERRDDHTRVWEIVREVETIHPDGSTTVDAVKSYIHEKGSGLCYKDASGNYVPAVAEWRETPDGFVIDRCAYGLAIGKKIGAGLGYNVEGHELAMRPAYLMVSDGVNEAHLALLNPNVQGFIVDGKPSVVRFPAAFGPGYDLEYVAEKGGFHQNLIIAACPELPKGFDANRAEVYLYTQMGLEQYVEASDCEVLVEGKPVDTTAGDLISPASRGGSISFRCPIATSAAGTRIVHGFHISRVEDSPQAGSVPVHTAAEKRIIRSRSDGTVYLVESVSHSYFSERSPSYPVIWDFEQKTGPVDEDETWEPRNTYWVTSTVNVSATLTILPATTIKLNPSTSITISSGGKILSRGEPYNYITFTSWKDDCSGEDLTTGQQTAGAPGDFDAALVVESGASDLSEIVYCKIGYATKGIEVYADLNVQIQHNIIRDFYMDGIYQEGCSNTMLNNLIRTVLPSSHSRIGVHLSNCDSSEVLNNTISAAPGYGFLYGVYFDDTPPGAYHLVMHNLITEALYASHGNGDYCAWNNALWNCPLEFYNPYQESGTIPLSGEPYVTPPSPAGDCFIDFSGYGEPLRDAGLGESHEFGLDADQFSQVKPIECQGTQSGTQEWSPITDQSKDIDYVDIGYHHNRIDRYLTSGYTISGSSSTLTIGPGTVVAVGGDEQHYYRAARADYGATLICNGAPDDYNIFTRRKPVSMMIESPHYKDYWRGWLQVYPGANSDSQVTFSRFERGASLEIKKTLNKPVMSNIFRLTYYGLEVDWASTPARVTSSNNLFHWCYRGYFQYYSYGKVINSTFDGCDKGAYLYMNGNDGTDYQCVLHDDLFTSCGLGVQGYAYGEAWAFEKFNHFFDVPQGSEYVINGQSGIDATDRVLQSTPYGGSLAQVEAALHGVISDWYLNQSRPSKDGGSKSSCDAGLRYYTTDASGSLDGGQVDIGYHHLLEQNMFFVDPANGVDDPNDPQRGSFSKPFRTIQWTIDLNRVLPGDSIVLLPGQYFYATEDEGIEVAKQVNILGSGADETVLTGEWDPEEIYGNPSGTPLLRIVPGGDSTTLEGVTIQHRSTEDPADTLGEDKGFGGGVRIGEPVNGEDPWGEWNGVEGVSIRYCTIRENHADFGGGICCVNSDAAIQNCFIYGNICYSGWQGGGIFCRSGFSSPLSGINIKNCVIAGNSAGFNRAPEYDGGGGIACASSSPIISRCIFANNATNSVVHGSGGEHPWQDPRGCGGAIRLAKWQGDSSASSPMVEDCLIINNMACSGGGIAAAQDSEASIHRCLLSRNYAGLLGGAVTVSFSYDRDDKAAPRIRGCRIERNTAAEWAGAIYSDDSSPIIANCLISHNNAGEWNAMRFDESTGYPDDPDLSKPEIYNCTIVYNSFPDDSADYDAISNPSVYCDIRVANCVIYYNGDEQFEEVDQCWKEGYLGDAYPRYCNLKNLQIPGHGDGNMNDAPQFVMTASGPLHLDLDYSSSCREKGNNADAYDHDPEEPPEEDPDVDGDERIIDSDNQEGATIDMGADECYPFKADCKIEKAMTDSTYDITLTWRSPDHALSPTYEVYRSFDPYGDDMTWELIDSKGPDGVTTSSEDHIENGDSKAQAFYKVRRILSGEADVDCDPVGFVNVPVEPGWNLISVPLQTRYDGINEPDDEALRVGRMIGERLPDGTKLYMWVFIEGEEENPDYYDNEELVWDVSEQKWQKDGDPSQRDLVRGDAAVLNMPAQGGPPVITFLGWVPMDLGKAARIHWEGKEDLEVAWGNPYPAMISLEDIPFLAYGYETRTQYSEPDIVKILPRGASSQGDWIKLYLKESAAGVPDYTWCYYDGPLADEPAPEPLLRIEPGQGFHYLAPRKISGERWKRNYLAVARPWPRS